MADGVANKVEGNTNVVITGGEVSNFEPDTNGGNVYGGGYSRNQNVGGNTSVTIGGDAYILQSVYGGGRYFIFQGANNVAGNTEVNIEGGEIDGDIYGGAQLLSTVSGSSTINLNNIDDNNIFSQTFEQYLYRGNRNETSSVNFSNYTAYFKGNIGNESDTNYTGSFDTVAAHSDSKILFVGGKKYYSNLWEIEQDGQISFLSSSTLNNYNENAQVINSGEISLNNENAEVETILSISGSYVAESKNSIVSMYANTNIDKNYISILGSATVGNASTEILLNLDDNWEHTRIDLIESDISSNPETFIMNKISVNGGYAVLKYEQIEDKTIWYIEFEEDTTTGIVIAIVMASLLILFCIIIYYIMCRHCDHCN